MIKVYRSRINTPSILLSTKATKALEEARRYFSSLDSSSKAQTRFVFDESIYRATEVRKSLELLFRNKCAYCETPITTSDEGEVDHFRPKMRAIELNGVERPGYWWLAYEWSNMYLSCRACMQMKADRFPLEDSSSGGDPLTTDPLLAAEKPLLLDPCGPEEPGVNLLFTERGQVFGATRRGQITIQILRLNREPLVAARLKQLQELHNFLQTFAFMPIIDDLKALMPLFNILSEQKPYTLARRQFTQRWMLIHQPVWSNHVLHLLDDLFTATEMGEVSLRARHGSAARLGMPQQPTYSVEDRGESPDEAYYSGARRVERIVLNNFKAIERLDLHFPEARTDQEPWMMLLGENGSGKSSILQGVALALMGQRRANDLGLDASTFVRHGQAVTHGSVEVHLTNLERPIELRFRQTSSQFEVVPEQPQVLLLAYGPTRLLPRVNRLAPSLDTFIRAANLFDPTCALNDADSWLNDTNRLDDAQFNRVALSLKDLMMFDPDDRIVRRGGELKVELFHASLLLRELSDGFQSVVAMACDIMISLMTRWRSIDAGEAIVLLDEIEAHLHPSWKIEIVERLRRCFPRVSFIATTHDPLLPWAGFTPAKLWFYGGEMETASSP